MRLSWPVASQLRRQQVSADSKILISVLHHMPPNSLKYMCFVAGPPTPPTHLTILSTPGTLGSITMALHASRSLMRCRTFAFQSSTDPICQGGGHQERDEAQALLANSDQSAKPTSAAKHCENTAKLAL